MHFLFVFLSRIRTVKSPKRHKKSRIPSWRHFSVEVSSDSWMRPFGKKFACWVNGWEWFRTLKEEGIHFKRCGLFRYFFSSVCIDFFRFVLIAFCFMFACRFHLENQTISLFCVFCKLWNLQSFRMNVKPPPRLLSNKNCN